MVITVDWDRKKTRKSVIYSCWSNSIEREFGWAKCVTKFREYSLNLKNWLLRGLSREIIKMSDIS